MHPSLHSDENPGASDRTVDNVQEDVPAQTKTGRVVPVVEETLRVETHEKVTEKVRVHTVTDTMDELARADLRSEAVEVTRVPIDRIVDSIPAVRTENDVTIVPVLEEVLFVEKRLVLKEELHIRRHVGIERVEVPVTLRKQRAIVERVTPSSRSNDDEETTT
jgi:stress response protein YsnF